MAYKRPSSHTLNTLHVFAGILSGSVRSPNTVLHVMLREENLDYTDDNRKRMSQRFRAMRRQGYLSKRDDAYVFTNKGLAIMEKEKLWALSIPALKKYDGLWRILVFDIPKKKSGVRIVFVRHLQNLGLRFFQRSVWIHPYPFEKEVKKIANAYGITQYLSFITAVEIDRSAALRKEFQI